MKAIGITCGIGSMLLGARQAGFKVVGNVEWRKYYHAKDADGRNTFKENFPGADFHYSLDHMSQDDIEKFFGADIALGHPECGNFSQLSFMNPDKTSDPADIPLFVDLVAKLKPRFFVMDDLPRSFIAFPMSEYVRRLPDYDLFPEWISNYHYGNVQKHRKRMFMIGALKDERWAFRSGERENPLVMKDVIGDLPEPRAFGNYPNHDPHVMDEVAGRGLHLVSLGRGARVTFRDIVEYMKDKPAGHRIRYVSADGSVKEKPGSCRTSWEGTAHVLDGGSYALHHHRLTPLTIRERALIQGFPDDFVFYGTILNERGEWNHDKNIHMVKQTGKAMPVQFCRYISRQIAAAIKGDDFTDANDQRLIAPNEHVDRAKYWYCENVGYADQERACAACWLYDRCTIRARKYQVGEPVRGQRDLYDPGVVPSPEAPEPPAEKPRVRVKAQSQRSVVTPRPVQPVETKDYNFGG